MSKSIIHLSLVKKIIFINEVSDKIKNILSEIVEKYKSDIKIFLFSQT